MPRPIPSTVIAAALAAAALAMASPATAQQQGQRNQPAQPAQTAPQPPPGMTAEKFGDWTVLCPKPNEAPPGAVCFMTQEIVNPQTKLGVAAMAIAKPPGAPDPMIGFNLPPQIDPKKPIGLKIDQGNGASLPVERCDQQKCSSETRLPKEILAQFVKGNEALVLFAVPNQDRPVGVKFSLKGFGAAFKALDRKRG